MIDEPTDEHRVRVREQRFDGQFAAVDAVVRSPYADSSYACDLRELEVAVLPHEGDVELWVSPATDDEAVARLGQLVEFDIVMDHRFGAAREGERPARIDERLAELSAGLGVDAVRVAARSLVDSVSSPRSGSPYG